MVASCYPNLKTCFGSLHGRASAQEWVLRSQRGATPYVCHGFRARRSGGGIQARLEGLRRITRLRHSDVKPLAALRLVFAERADIRPAGVFPSPCTPHGCLTARAAARILPPP